VSKTTTRSTTSEASGPARNPRGHLKEQTLLAFLGRGVKMKRFKSKAAALVAASGLAVGLGAGSVAAPAAQAWPWSSSVNVWFNVSACSGAPGQWGWYQTSDGEAGWVSWNAGYQGTFNLSRVSSSGSVTRISWGYAGRTCGTRYFNLTRPSWGTTDALGWIG
jgi:hypothetical protein